MKIVSKAPNPNMTFYKSIKSGECFHAYNNYYMKLSNRKSVGLESGYFYDGFTDSDFVELLPNAKFIPE